MGATQRLRGAKGDPLPLVPLLGYVTKHLGIVPTINTSFYPPYLASRLGATLDHLTQGRVGLNVVTGHNDRSAQNFGLDRHYEHDLRYEMADESMEVVDRLWASWEPDAIVADNDTGVFADYKKVSPIIFGGTLFFKSRGPLNAAPGPQGRPVICQAGGSPAGRAFAARHADLIIARVRDVSAAKTYRQDISRLMMSHGRKATDCKVMFASSVMLGDTIAEARERRTRTMSDQERTIDVKLATMSHLSEIDFSTFDLDAPLPQIKTNASRAAFASLLSGDGNRTLREIVLDPGSGGLDFTGTADRVSAEMKQALEEIGGDGFLIFRPLDADGNF